MLDRETYRKAFHEIPFSADFQDRTEDLLRKRVCELDKEDAMMTFGKMKKMALITAAAIAALVVSVSAAFLWLTPSQAAAEVFGRPDLAEAFAGEGAVAINETVESGDFSLSLLGIASGESLNGWQGADASRTYAILALQNVNGEPIDQQSFDFGRYTLTPLVSGFAPWKVNNWTLNAALAGGAQDGVYYYLLDVQNLNMFADRTVYLAFYEGMTPSADIFAMDQDGSISFSPDFSGVHALFTLPLDPALADPDAVADFIANNELMNDDRSENGGDVNNGKIIAEMGENGELIIRSVPEEGGESAAGGDGFPTTTYQTAEPKTFEIVENEDGSKTVRGLTDENSQINLSGGTLQEYQIR